MRDYIFNKPWSDQFRGRIRVILEQNRNVLIPKRQQSRIITAPLEDDLHYNTDFIEERISETRIACRIRRAKFQNYLGEITIRSRLPSGVKTELAKIIDGYGDYMLYGYASPDEQRIVNWTLGDLDVFRVEYAKGMRGRLMTNKDGSSDFRVFRALHIPGFIVATTLPLEPVQPNLLAGLMDFVPRRLVKH